MAVSLSRRVISTSAVSEKTDEILRRKFGYRTDGGALCRREGSGPGRPSGPTGAGCCSNSHEPFNRAKNQGVLQCFGGENSESAGLNLSELDKKPRKLAESVNFATRGSIFLVP